MKIVCFTIIILTLIAAIRPQATNLSGEYRHEKKNEFYSILNFKEDKFTLIQGGDLGKFFGKGTHQLIEGTD